MEASYTHDKNKDKKIKEYFLFLNEMKINYFLGFGSELGSYRNKGVIINDHDIDIIVPLWLNYHIFNCNYYLQYKPSKCKIYTHPKYKICNKTKYDYMMILKNYIENKNKSKIYYKCTYFKIYGYTSCWMFYTKYLFLDIWILLGNEYVYDNIYICKCMFSNSVTYCTQNALNNIIRLYGMNYSIPIKRGSGEVICNSVIYPNKHNAYKKRIKIYS